MDKEVANYRSIGYPVDLTGASSGAGVEGFAAFLHHRLSVLAGKSGAGQTNILNAVQPGLGLRAGAVSAMTVQGKHLQIAGDMFPLAGGGGVVDTSGVPKFGLWDVHQDDIATLFREFRPYVDRCRFSGSCRHGEEPGCAITAAVGAEQITPRRYHSYRRLAS